MKIIELTQLNLGNAFFNIIHSSKYSDNSINIIKSLYNENACKILVENITNDKYCENIFSSLLIKGLAQTIVHMSNIINNCKDELTTLKMTKNLTNMYSINNYYYNFEIVVGYYFFNSFLITRDAFTVFRNDERNYIFNIHETITIIYIVFVLIIIVYCSYIIYTYQKKGKSLWNFIAIIPNKFILDDENFYDSVIKLGDILY